jgi:S1-C subfamily serine protease
MRNTIKPELLAALCFMCAEQPAFAAGRGYLGVWFAALPATEKAITTGVVVKKVFADSAAQRAGLKQGELITKINGVYVGDPKTAVALVAEGKAGESILLTVIDRSGGGTRRSNVIATLATDPPHDFAAIMTVKSTPRLRHSPTSSTAHHCESSTKTSDRACRIDSSADH